MDYDNKYDVLEDYNSLVQYDTIYEHVELDFDDEGYIDFIDKCIIKYDIDIELIESPDDLYNDGFYKYKDVVMKKLEHILCE